jgi:HSP20 family protein
MDTQVQKHDSDLSVRENSAVTGTYEGQYFEPPVDIYETADALILRADIPGAAPDDVQTHLEDNLLTISAKHQSTEGNWRPVYQEYTAGHYVRQFRLGQQIDQANIAAELRDGVLTLTLPKTDTAKPRRIQVKAG